MQKLLKILGILAAVAIVFVLLLYFSLRYRVDSAVHEARQEIESCSPGPRLVHEGQWRGSASSSFKVLTRLAPVNDVAVWKFRPVVATDGGLVIHDEEGNTRIMTAADGLAGTRVLCLATFRDLLFAGTDQGLSIFEGEGFRSFRFESGKANRISCLHAARHGVMIGTRGNGLLYYSAGEISYHPDFRDRLGLMVTAVSHSGERTAIGTWNNGVIIESPEGRTMFHEKAGFHGPVNSLLQTSDGLLAGTPLNLYKINSNHEVNVLIPGVSAISLAEHDGAVFMACRNGGIARLKDDKYSHEFKSRKFRALSVGKGVLYASGASGVLVRKEDRFIEPFPKLLPRPGVLSENRLTDVVACPAGRLWIGTFESGVDVLSPGLLDSVNLAEPCCLDVNCIRKGRYMYVGTGRGVLVYSGESLRKKLDKESGLIGGSVFDVLEKDETLIAATNRGISFHSEADTRSIYAFHGLVNNHVYSLAALGDRLAAGTLGGLSLVDDYRVVENFRVNNSALRHNWITALAVKGDDMYAGTFGGGVVAVTGHNKWKELPGPYSDVDVNQNALLVWDDLLLAGTFGEGLLAYDTSRGYWRKIDAPLTSRNVTGLAKWKDQKGRGLLAVATDCGLNLLYPGELME